jgi:hypothetical protein
MFFDSNIKKIVAFQMHCNEFQLPSHKSVELGWLKRTQDRVNCNRMQSSEQGT